MILRFILAIIGICFGVPCMAEMLDRPARAIEMPLPRYPESFKRDGRSGLATVVVRVDEKGISTVEQVMGSTTDFSFAAKAAVKNWKFTPAMRDRKPAVQRLEFIVIFDPKKGVEVLGPLFP